MSYQISNGTVPVGGKLILSYIDFEIRGNEKIAVVSKNRAGKTILLKPVAGELSLDRDGRRKGAGIRCSRQLTVGMFPQQAFKGGSKTVEEELLEACPCRGTFEREYFEYECEYDTFFTGSGLPEEGEKRRISQLSGGEQTKIALIRPLLEKPDIPLLGELTNHLDMEIAEWLERYMRHYRSAVVMVSHDRLFLDQTTDVVYELSGKVLRRYPGNYIHYREEKPKQIQLQKKTYEHQQEELAHLEGLVERFRHRPSKASFVRAKGKTMKHMERVEKPQEDNVHISTGEINSLLSGSRWVFTSKHLETGYERSLLEITMCVQRGQKIALLRSSEAGKTTFSETIAGFPSPLEGSYSLGSQTAIGYFDQHSGAIQSEQAILEHLAAQFPVLTENGARSTLGTYLFGRRDAQEKVGSSSGGEKARLILAELLQSRPDFLILNEPTSHMDTRAKETLESAFCAYKGTILLVFHDRCFIRQVTDVVMIFERQSMMYYPFGYEHYLEHKARKDQNGSMAAQIRAEGQALIVGIHTMLKAERHRLREISEDEAYRGRNIRLMAERLEPAEDAVRYPTGQMRGSRVTWQGSGAYWSDGVWGRVNEYENQCLRLKQAWEGWRRACIGWLDKVQEMKAL